MFSHRTILAVLLTIALPATLWAGSRSATAIRLFNEGIEQVKAGQYNNGVSLMDQAISADGNFAEAYYVRGVCKHALKALDAAVMDLGDALRLDPDLLDARSLRAAVHYEADRFDQALDDADAVLRKKPNEPQALLIRGIIRLKRDEREAAAQDLRAFVRARPDDPNAAQVREVLASLGGSDKSSAPPADHSPSVAARKASSHKGRRAAAETAPQPATSSDLADALSRRLLRGESGPIVGDIERRETLRMEK